MNWQSKITSMAITPKSKTCNLSVPARESLLIHSSKFILPKDMLPICLTSQWAASDFKDNPKPYSKERTLKRQPWKSFEEIWIEGNASPNK